MNACTRHAVVGWTGSVLTTAMYAAPLSTARRGLAEKSAASIHLPLLLTSIANTLLWTTYGFISNRIFVWPPIGLGLLFNVILLMLKIVFRGRRSKVGVMGW